MRSSDSCPDEEGIKTFREYFTQKMYYEVRTLALMKKGLRLSLDALFWRSGVRTLALMKKGLRHH